jgi:glycosyltransferase involved in cell wall biosynthesis
MVEVAFAVPGDLASPTGGYAYARRLLALLPEQGVRVRHIPLPASYPHPSAADLIETERLLRGAPEEAVLLIDGLAYGALPPSLVRGLGRRIVALVHHPLGFEAGHSETRRSQLIDAETRALAHADRVIACSAATARALTSDFAVPSARIAVAEPGTEPARRSTGTGSPVQLLAVGAVSERKAYPVLVAALRDLADFDWRLTIVGSLDHAPEASAALYAAIQAARLRERVTVAGAVDERRLALVYDAADVFVSPSLFEGYGMVLAEAMARGLPLVASTGGAAAETVPASAGLKVSPGDVAALRDALRRMIADRGVRDAFAEGSWAAGQSLPRWTDTAARVADTLKAVAA